MTGEAPAVVLSTVKRGAGERKARASPKCTLALGKGGRRKKEMERERRKESSNDLTAASAVFVTFPSTRKWRREVSAEFNTRSFNQIFFEEREKIP